MALPTIHPVIIMDRTDPLIMLDRTGGTGTGHVAIGGTIEFRANSQPMPFEENLRLPIAQT